MGQASRLKEERRREKQSSEAPHQSRGKKTRREARRLQERLGAVVGQDFKIIFDMTIPGDGGKLRDVTPVRLAGTVVGDSEASVLRNVIIKALEGFGYVNQPRAAAGVLAEAVNAFPVSIRGNLAIGIIKGTGLLVTEDSVEVCKDCKVERSRTLAPEQPPMVECLDCDRLIDEHREESYPGYHEDDQPDPVMLDTTPHTATCHVNRITSDTGAPLNPIEYVEEPAVMILQPPHWVPLDTPPQIAPETEAPAEYTDTAGNVIEFPQEKADDAGDATS